MPTALITGASSGIGRAIAIALAKEGNDLLLIGRNAKALEDTSKECLRSGASRVELLVLDLTDSHALPSVKSALQKNNMSIDILVNNAGIGVHGNFQDTNLENELSLIHGQLDAMLGLTKLVLPAMLAQGKGKILNVASLYSFTPVPSQSVYGAAKAFLLSFSESLAYELRKTGISVTVLCPGSTKSNFRIRAGIDVNKGMEPEVVARAGIMAMNKGRFLVVPGIQNLLFILLMKHLPLGIRPRIMQFINLRRGVIPKHS